MCPFTQVKTCLRTSLSELKLNIWPYKRQAAPVFYCAYSLRITVSPQFAHIFPSMNAYLIGYMASTPMQFAEGIREPEIYLSYIIVV